MFNDDSSLVREKIHRVFQIREHKSEPEMLSHVVMVAIIPTWVITFLPWRDGSAIEVGCYQVGPEVGSSSSSIRVSCRCRNSANTPDGNEEAGGDGNETHGG